MRMAGETVVGVGKEGGFHRDGRTTTAIDVAPEQLLQDRDAEHCSLGGERDVRSRALPVFG
jgi:hypothetical protein